ncbi:hypothetical protein NEOCIP111885_02809 [Pseudoneobacillus rhizosphaerae]|uniref:Uncharacterized protein n=1 Tax=Pseudoneobacillus rhizosphaerae TaxID=2880968 RepID=A0A9C7GB22_9BACI|nr:hypothetical protein NEOCIP111885_02809 [Pseudoneobacillus rhizosphaerae]
MDNPSKRKETQSIHMWTDCVQVVTSYTQFSTDIFAKKNAFCENRALTILLTFLLFL